MNNRLLTLILALFLVANFPTISFAAQVPAWLAAMKVNGSARVATDGSGGVTGVWFFGDVDEDPLTASTFAKLAELPELRFLSLAFSDGQLPVGDFRAFVKRSNIEVLQFECGTTVTKEIIDAVSYMTALKKLRIISCVGFDSSAAASLDKLSSLVSLSAPHCHLDNAFAPTIRKMGQIEELSLSYTEIGDSVLVALGENQHLRILRLAGTKISDAGLSALGRCKGLEELDLTKTNVSIEAIQRLCDLGRIRTIVLSTDYLSKSAVKVLATKYPKISITVVPGS
ncbi:MAG TPA: hypothetical protein VFE47_06430 [Tepidisphaeraceae bacterium]|jgi:hypothetical protein|nr:hypothetical protein [Tepidisphaeraceae bacterium]